MEAVTLLPHGRALTRADLDTMPDDGHRYELIDGSLVVSPGPTPRHQLAVTRLVLTLAGAAPDGIDVLAARLDVALSDSTVLQPDVVVAPRSAFGERDLPTAPLLAVEVLSPSTRLIDLNTKRIAYEEAGCASYWVVDPAVPSLVAWELVGSRYVEVAHVVGDEPAELDLPFPVVVTPSAMVV
jgi:Uma2 family endonuclease